MFGERPREARFEECRPPIDRDLEQPANIIDYSMMLAGCQSSMRGACQRPLPSLQLFLQLHIFDEELAQLFERAFDIGFQRRQTRRIGPCLGREMGDDRIGVTHI